MRWMTISSRMSTLKKRRGTGQWVPPARTQHHKTLFQLQRVVCTRGVLVYLSTPDFSQPFTEKVIFVLEGILSKPLVLAQMPLSLANLPIQPQVTVPLWLVPSPSTNTFSLELFSEYTCYGPWRTEMDLFIFIFLGLSTPLPQLPSK